MKKITIFALALLLFACNNANPELEIAMALANGELSKADAMLCTQPRDEYLEYKARLIDEYLGIDELDKAINDIAELPDDVVLVTTNKQIIANCVKGVGKKKIILIKSCGLDQKLPNRLSDYEDAIIANGGLVISRYPAEKLPEQYNFIESKFIASGICDAVFVVKLVEKGTDMVLIGQHLAMGREIMVYPTFPKWDNAINNTLISEGGILVEDADDIKREIYNN